VIFTEGSEGHQNEDVVVVRRLREGWLGAVADGQGGRSGGAKAAKLACEAIVNRGCDLEPDALVQSNTWWDLFRAVDRSVVDDSEAGFTTLVGFLILDGYVYGASCGDGAAYLCNANSQLIELTVHQQKNPQIGSGLTSCTFFRSPLVKPWRFLAMTDGVWKYAGREKLAELLTSATGQDLGAKLQAAGRLPGSGKFPDDYSFALIEG
jgi:PPM family protein phosphatase